MTYRALGRQTKPVCEINIVPYIDVMLVLLIIFMITTPLLTQGVHVDLPSAVAKPVVFENQEPIIVSVDVHGHYSLNIGENTDTMTNAQQLVNRIAAELAFAKLHHKTRDVLVKGDHRVDYGYVVDVMLLLQKAGVGHVGLMTEPWKQGSVL